MKVMKRLLFALMLVLVPRLSAQAVKHNFTSCSRPRGITFSRSTTGKYFDSTHTVQTAAIDAPGFDQNEALQDTDTGDVLQTSTLTRQTFTGTVSTTDGNMIAQNLFMNIAGSTTNTNTYYNSLTETLSDYLCGLVTICTTNDGSTPTGASGTRTHGIANMTTPTSIAFNGTVLKAVAAGTGGTNSAVASATYTLTVAPPVFDVPAGQVRTGALVSISTPTQGATLLWAIGSMPSCPSTGTVYTAPITVSAASTLYAIGCKTGFPASAVTSAAYTVRPAQTFYISSSTGNDANNGTSTSTPWAHIPGQSACGGTCAATTPVGGDSYLLKKGDTWTASLTVPRSGDSGANITIASYGTGAMPYWTGADANVPIAVLDIARGYWTIDGIKFHVTGTYPNMGQAMAILHANFLGGPESDSPEPGWIVQNCTSDAAFWLTGPNTIVRNNLLDGSGNDGTLQGNASHGASLGAIVISGINAPYAQIYSNEVRYWAGRGIWTEEGSSHASIHDNVVHDLVSYSDPINVCWCGQGIDLDGAGVPEDGHDVYNNDVYNIFGFGINLENTTNTTIHANRIHNTRAGAISSVHYDGKFSTYVYAGVPSYNHIYNNVIWNAWECASEDSEPNTLWFNNSCYGGYNSYAHIVYGGVTDKYDGSPDTYGWHGAGSISSMTLANNIITGYACPVNSPSGAIWMQFDYNDLYGTGTTVFCDGNNHTLAQTQALGFMTHGISADPKFVSPPTDLRLQPSSPAMHTGTSVTAPYAMQLLPTPVFPWALMPHDGLTPNIGAFGWSSTTNTF